MKSTILSCLGGSLITLLSIYPNSLQSQENKHYNFIVIFADDLGYGDLGSYGHPTSLTPHMDEVAKSGLRFTQFYSSSPVCSPARACLLTGRLAARNGVYCANDTEACSSPDESGCCNGGFEPDSAGGLPLSEVTMAKALGPNWATAFVGKW